MTVAAPPVLARGELLAPGYRVVEHLSRQRRLDAFGEAIWAVYDLRQLWKSMGPRQETIRKEATPGRNDPCPCGSGRKYKQCHGRLA